MTVFTLLVSRAAYIQLVVSEELQDKGNARFARNQTIPANRGMIRDRNGEILAISTPEDSILGVPEILSENLDELAPLAKELGLPLSELNKNVHRWMDENKRGVLLKRQLTPDQVAKVMALEVPGVSRVREYRRFYTNANTTSSLLGITSIDDKGLEGIELAFNDKLEGQSGLNRVINDSRGRTVESVARIRSVEDGEDVDLSIDIRIQQILYNRLAQAIQESKASFATGAVIDPKTGEILAIATAPSSNPNLRDNRKVTRNKAVTDVFEPGSVIKPFTIAKAIQVGLVEPETMIDTRPGHIKVDGYIVKDIRNFETLSVADVVMRSSNVALVKIGLQLDPDELVGFYKKLGFGRVTQNVMPGEETGLFPVRTEWKESQHATLSYGYGFAVTPLQVVRAYGVFANQGKLMPLTILKNGNANEQGEQVINPELARTISGLLERTVLPTGTAKRAKLPLYRVAGKSGTIQKLINKKYSSERHFAVFVGYAPATNPRLAAVIVVDDPRTEVHYGGVVAAPVFRDVMSESLRLLNEPYDDLQKLAMN